MMNNFFKIFKSYFRITKYQEDDLFQKWALSEPIPLKAVIAAIFVSLPLFLSIIFDQIISFPIAILFTTLLSIYTIWGVIRW